MAKSGPSCCAHCGLYSNVPLAQPPLLTAALRSPCPAGYCAWAGRSGGRTALRLDCWVSVGSTMIWSSSALVIAGSASLPAIWLSIFASSASFDRLHAYMESAATARIAVGISILRLVIESSLTKAYARRERAKGDRNMVNSLSRATCPLTGPPVAKGFRLHPLDEAPRFRPL